MRCDAEDDGVPESMSERRRRSLSKITEGTQALVGVVDTTLELEKPILGRHRSHEGRVSKPSPRSGGNTPRRRGSVGASFGSDPDIALVLQNSGMGDLSVSVRRINSESDVIGLRKTRRSFDSLESVSASRAVGGSRGPSPEGSRRTSVDLGEDLSRAAISSRRSSKDLGTPMLSRGPSIESDASAPDEDKHLEDACLRRASKALAAMPGRSVASIKKRPRYGVMDAPSKRGITLLTHNIALGGRDDANNFQKLKKFGITHVLNVAAQMPLFFPGEFVYLKIPMQDTDDTNVEQVMPHATSFISNVERVKGRVLVHCISGVSRSTTVVLMYMMQKHNICLLDAYNYVRSCRPFIEPNKGFRLQLAEAELRKCGTSSVASKAAGKAFNFYEWNIKKDHVERRKASGNNDSDEHEDGSRRKRGGCLDYLVRACDPR